MLANNLTPLNVKCTLIKLVTQGKVGIVSPDRSIHNTRAYYNRINGSFDSRDFTAIRKRNCLSYQAELKKRKSASIASTSGLRESRKLKHEALSLYMGNGMRATVKAIGSFNLILPSGLIIGYALESAVRILNMVQTKKVERMPYEIWHGKAPMLSYLRYPKETIASRSHGPFKSSGSDEGLEIIQEEDTQPSENNSEEHNDVAPIVVERQNVKVPIQRFTRIPQAPDRYGFYVDVVEYELGDLDEPPNYKDALSILDFGEATYILGIKIIRDRSKRFIALSQSAYLEKILKRFWMENSKKGYTPMIEKPDYRKSQGAKTPSLLIQIKRASKNSKTIKS
ncbi:hypothetical protein Tco_0308259 [Tanacetum coccineum]